MEAAHVVILRKNLVYLKEHLVVGEVLDHLYQEGIFTQPEYSKCKQAGTEKCGTVLATLMKKGQDGYKSLCAVLERAQPHIKEQLDRTSAEEGSTNLLDVNKISPERKHKESLSEKDNIICKLQGEISDLRYELVRFKEELERGTGGGEEGRKLHLAEADEKKHIEEEKAETAKVEANLKEYEEQIENLKDKEKQLEEMLVTEREKYEAVTQISTPQSSEKDGHREALDEVASIDYNKQSCVFAVQPVCDESLMLLPCLHAACKPCIDHRTDQQGQGRLLCPCGGEVNSKVEELPIDHVRRNEAAFKASKDKSEVCTYMDHDSEVAATMYCQNCNSFLCTECETIHNKLRTNRNHQTTEIQKMETILSQIKELEEMYCLDHSDHKLMLYDNCCRKPICVVCSLGNHKHSDNEDLKVVYKQKKATMETLLEKYRVQLTEIKEFADVLRKHQNELKETAVTLTSEVVSVHQKVAVKFLRRQKQLLRDIHPSLEGPNQAVKEKLKTVLAAENNVNSVIDYIQRVVECPTKAELISLSDAVQKKSVEDLKMELPSDDTRDTRVRLSFQGQKALEEIIDDFGSLVTCLHSETFADSQPTCRDLQRELTEVLKLKQGEHQEARTEMNQLMETVALREREIEKNGNNKNELTEALTIRDKEIEEIRKEKNELTEALGIRDKEIEENRKERNRLTEILTLRDREMEEQKQETNQLVKTMSLKDREIEGNKKEKNELTEALAIRDKKIVENRKEEHRLMETLTLRNKEIVEMKQETEILTLQSRKMEEKKQEINRLMKTTLLKDREIEENRKEKNVLTEALAIRDKKIEENRKASNLLRDNLIRRYTEIVETKQEKNQMAETLALRDKTIEENVKVMKADKEKITKLENDITFIKEVSALTTYSIGDTKSTNSSTVVCPLMTYSREQVWCGLDVSEDGQDLMKCKESGRGHHNVQFKNYKGTCGHLPIPLPPSTFTAPRYWETNTRLQVRKGSLWPMEWQFLLEMGVTEEGRVDTEQWIHRQSRGWSVIVRACDKHLGSCTQVCGEGSQFGVCQTDTLSKTPATDVTLRYGCVLDVGRGRLAFIDVNREIVLHKFGVRFTQPLRPMFSVCPLSDPYTINMRLVSGGDIIMTDKKKALIFTALS